MTIPALSYTELMAINPCPASLHRIAKLMGGAKKWNGVQITADQARKAGATFDDIVWAASAISQADKDVERRLRLWMADCAARVLQIYECKYLKDDRPRNAIIAARQFARGEINASAAAASAAAAAYAAASAAAAAYAAASAAAAYAYAYASAAASAAAAYAYASASAASAAAAAYAASSAEKEWQFDRLIEWLGDKEPEDYPLPLPPVAP